MCEAEMKGLEMKRISQRCFLFSVVLVTGMTVHGESVVGYYIGAKAHSLTRVDNWKDSIRPGRFNEGGETNGAYGGTMIFDDQATGWGTRLTSTELVSISNMIFSGSSAVTFTVPDYNKVRFESGGRLEVAQNSRKTLSFNTGARLLINDVNCKKNEKPMPKLPVATNFWEPLPNLYTGAEAWILAGGAHHTAFSYDLSVEQMVHWAESMGIEAVVIDKNTTIGSLKKELRWNSVAFK
jgi:hypothetical protein